MSKQRHNPHLKFKHTEMVYKNGVRVVTDAEVTILLEKVVFDNDQNVILPVHWTPEKISDEIVRLICIQGKRVLEKFEVVNAAEIKRFKRRGSKSVKVNRSDFNNSRPKSR